MMWEDVRLGEYIDILSGYSFKSKDFIDSGIPVIKIKNVTPPTVSLIDLSFVSKEVANTQKKFQLQYNDVLVALTGSHINQMTSVVGRVARVKYNEWTVLNQRVGKIYSINAEACNIDYIYYYLSQDKIKIELANQAGGAANQANISPNDIKSLKIKLPPIETQKRIADILSAYDNLIENNQKQIKLLEEMAQRLYKEWFVDLRFPNYENTEIVDGVPKGWKVDKLGHYVIVNSENLSSNYNGDYIDYVDIGSVSQGRILKKTKYALREAPGRAKRIAHDGDTIWGMVRPNLKAFSLVLSPTANEIYSTGFAIVTPKSIPYTFLHCFLTQDSFIGYLVNCTNGAAYPAVKPIHFEESNILIPNNIVLNEFHEKTDSIFRKIHQIDLQINLLQQARDRLLPKLMNRELEV